MHECVTTSTYSTRGEAQGLYVLVVTHECILLRTAQLGEYVY